MKASGSYPLDTSIIIDLFAGDQNVQQRIAIAAIAIQHGFTLLARDAHFQEIEQLSVEIW